ncbi:helix-turn-helix transcriptional regulator [Herbaspirillum sp. DW155]|uniref:helix-turn-helix domain-containing protein n=1 Tax=Herbaspirillum sp. DW155 TaxID=3095609 RepID=UPI0030CE26F0
MNTCKQIREQLGLTQRALAQVLGCTQSNVSQYENDAHGMPVETAKVLIEYAKTRGVSISFEDVYVVPGAQDS